MQHTQFNVVNRKFRLALTLLPFLAGQPVLAGPITQPSRPDPLLDGGPTAPCAAGADYAPGADANGAAVAPADVGAGPVPVPDAIAIPLNRGHREGRSRPGLPDSAYVRIDSARLAPLLNPPPCTPAR